VLFSIALLLVLGLLRTQWGQSKLDPTIELAAQLEAHPVIQALTRFHGDDNLALASGMSAENHQAFEQSFIAVLESADAGMRREGKPPSQNIDLDQLQRRYREIRQPLTQRHGEQVADYLARRRFETLPAFNDTRVLCDYRIDQLDAILREPPAMAARMLDAAMR
jgi:hypothetical protein